LYLSTCTRRVEFLFFCCNSQVRQVDHRDYQELESLPEPNICSQTGSRGHYWDNITTPGHVSTGGTRKKQWRRTRLGDDGYPAKDMVVEGGGGDDFPSDSRRPYRSISHGEAQDDLPGGVLCGARCPSSDV